MNLQPEGRPAVAASEYSHDWARRQQLPSDAVQGHLNVPDLLGALGTLALVLASSVGWPDGLPL